MADGDGGMSTEGIDGSGVLSSAEIDGDVSGTGG